MTDNQPNNQTDTDDQKYLRDQWEVIEQDVDQYTRGIELVEFVCACPNCPYCTNKTFWAHQNRRYCCPDALLEHRKRQRAEAAIAAGRIPGKRGRPPKKKPAEIIYMLRASGTNFYILDWTTDQESYQKVLADSQRTIPKGVSEIFTTQRHSSQETVATIYDLYSNAVINGKWIELSNDQVEHIEALLTNSD